MQNAVQPHPVTPAEAGAHRPAYSTGCEYAERWMPERARHDGEGGWLLLRFARDILAAVARIPTRLFLRVRGGTAWVGSPQP